MVGRLCIPRNQALGSVLLMKDYFAEVPTYSSHLFCRRYRMRRPLFVRIVEACKQNCLFFVQRRNAAGLLGFTSYQKISVAMRVIAYGVPAITTMSTFALAKIPRSNACDCSPKQSFGILGPNIFGVLMKRTRRG